MPGCWIWRTVLFTENSENCREYKVTVIVYVQSANLTLVCVAWPPTLLQFTLGWGL